MSSKTINTGHRQHTNTVCMKCFDNTKLASWQGAGKRNCSPNFGCMAKWWKISFLFENFHHLGL